MAPGQSDCIGVAVFALPCLSLVHTSGPTSCSISSGGAEDIPFGVGTTNPQCTSLLRWYFNAHLAYNLFLVEEWDIQACTKNDASDESSPPDSLRAGERAVSGFLWTSQLLT